MNVKQGYFWIVDQMLDKHKCAFTLPTTIPQEQLPDVFCNYILGKSDTTRAGLDQNKPKCVPSSTTFVYSGVKSSLSQTVSNLGLIIDASLSHESYINAVCKSIFFELRRTSHIRHFLLV